MPHLCHEGAAGQSCAPDLSGAIPLNTCEAGGFVATSGRAIYFLSSPVSLQQRGLPYDLEP
jgi:hypothetical protein